MRIDSMMISKRHFVLTVVFALLALHSNALEDYDRNYDNSASYVSGILDFPVPRLTRVVPSEGPMTGGATLTIWGVDFRYSDFITCRFAEKYSWEGNVWEVRATYISESKILCKTPNFDVDNGGMSSLCQTALTSAGTSCPDIYITVSNDRVTYSGYMGSMTGSYLTYTIWKGAPLLDVASTLGIGGRNSTVMRRGEVLLTITGTRAADTDVPIRESDQLECLFTTAAGPKFTAKATYIEATDSLTDIVTCRVPDLGALGSDENVDITIGYNNLNEGDTTFNVSTATVQILAKSGTSAANAPINAVLKTRDDLAQVLQRAPMWGNTEVTMKGEQFIPSEKARCAFVFTDGDWYTVDADCDNQNGWHLCTHASVAAGSPRCCTTTPASFTAYATGTELGYYRCMSPRHRHETESSYTYAPSIDVDVLLSLEDLDGGPDSGTKLLSDYLYSAPGTTLTRETRLRISNLYVSPSGSDKDIDASGGGGDGTPQRPYRTIQRAIDRAVINSRHPDDYENGPYGLMHGQPGALGSDQQFNRDLIVLKKGYYRGTGNTALHTRGKLLTIRSYWMDQGIENYGLPNGLEVVVDCENRGLGFIEERSQRYWDNDDNTERESVYVQGLTKKNCLNRRAYSVYDWKNQRNTLHRHPMVAYHQPDVSGDVLRNKQSIHPFANRFRPGWGGEPPAAPIP